VVSLGSVVSGCEREAIIVCEVVAGREVVCASNGFMLGLPLLGVVAGLLIIIIPLM